MRVPSDRPCETGAGGWFHFLKPGAERHIPPATERHADVDFKAWWTMAYQSTYSADTLPIPQWSRYLKVSEQSLTRLEIVEDEKGNQAFPMKNEFATICGIRIRDPRTAAKWCVPGSREGLFIPKGFDPCKPTTIVEGPTDCAAALDMGYNAIGRPSCLGGVAILRNLVEKYKTPACLVIIDNDQPKTRPDGSTWRPGEDGGLTLVKRLSEVCDAVVACMPPDKVKDLREWRTCGATKADVMKHQIWKGRAVA